MNPISHNLGSKFLAVETKSWLWSISFDTRSGFWLAEGTGLKNEWFFFRVVSCSNLSFVDQGFQSHVASNRDEMEQQMRNLFCSKTQISWIIISLSISTVDPESRIVKHSFGNFFLIKQGCEKGYGPWQRHFSLFRVGRISAKNGKAYNLVLLLYFDVLFFLIFS